MLRDEAHAKCVCLTVCVSVAACVCVRASVHRRVCLCAQAAQLSQPQGALCGPVIVVVMYFFNIEWNYRNMTTGRSKERERTRVRRRKRGVTEEEEPPASLGISTEH